MIYSRCFAAEPIIKLINQPFPSNIVSLNYFSEIYDTEKRHDFLNILSNFRNEDGLSAATSLCGSLKIIKHNPC